ncbi:globin domain-containing protein [Kitasatospora cathayae]|uniref:nitric oxide dioxygenase n=1 Tax=Kitasatospora cathayae TaxID=3004092 RepID=A0ABY7Q6C1_9ACTN|nr:globin domain-containing protein [Kitasatospora sp. HUAS 3-15]WBP87816.1 FAD-binding oxidoreductase [Kitasatospora sp. HUAS 3-15]
MKSRRTLLIRTGHGSAGAAAVPGLPELPPEPVAAEPVAPEPVAAEAMAAEAEPVRPPMPLDPPDLPPGPPGLPDLPPGPAHVRPAVPVIPPPPAEPPAVPPPSYPEPPSTTGTAPAFQPLFADAPGLNWSGPGDSWSDAWAAAQPSAAQLPVAVTSPAGAELPLTARDIELIRASLAVVEPVADRATAHFYALLFLQHPEVRSLFPAAMDVQRDRLFRALLAAARGAEDPAALRTRLSELGRGHRRYGTLTGHYAPVGECLVQALARYAGGRWDTGTELAWRRAYRLISTIMIEAAEEAARTSPPWWQGEVLRHERRTRDVAVLTVRPDQAYPFRAGQYCSLETPWWPRVWRHYSFASAPRPDGLLTFHVKAVPAGWVSNALVHRAAPGDVLRLGPAAGAMTVDHAAGTELLCLGGGTGIAPIRALVEEAAEHGGPGRSVEVFYGARRAAELYELDALRELSARLPWLTVRPALSGTGPAGGALTGELPEVVGRFGPWDGREAVLSGPPAMVRRGVGVLLRAGLPAERIRHDLVGELASR